MTRASISGISPFFIVSSLLASPAVLSAQGGTDTLPILIRRIDASTAAHLPLWLRAALGARKCLIPQMHSDERLNNIHRGHFVDSVTESYALLCSRNGESSVVILTKDSSLTPPPILVRADTSFLVLMEGGGRGRRWEFARFLSALSPREVKSWCSLSPIERDRPHEGVITFYQDRDATAYYFSRVSQTWLRCAVPGPE
jgi:hypothetical protein